MKITLMTVLVTLCGSYSMAANQIGNTPVLSNKNLNCYYIGGKSLSKDTISSYSATTTDKAFDSQKGIISLKPHQVTERGGFSNLVYTEWKNKQKIDIGYGYSLLVHLSYQDQVAGGDFLIDSPALEVSSILKFKNQLVSSASTRSYNIETDFNGKKVLLVSMQIDNLPLRDFLGAAGSPEADLMDLSSQYSDRSKLFTSFGDGAGVLTQADVSCSLEMP